MSLSNVVDGRTATLMGVFLAFGARAAWGQHKGIAVLFALLLALLAYAYFGLRAKVFEAGMELTDRRLKRRWAAWRDLSSAALSVGMSRPRPTLLTLRWPGPAVWSINVAHGGFREFMGHVRPRLPRRAVGASLRASEVRSRKDPRLRATRVWELSTAVSIIAMALLGLGLVLSMDWCAEMGVPAWALFGANLAVGVALNFLIEKLVNARITA